MIAVAEGLHSLDRQGLDQVGKGRQHIGSERGILQG